MPTVTILDKSTIAGYEFQSLRTITDDGAIIKEASPAAAKSGSLSTRTDDETGTLTMDAGHGITTGARLDIYWDGGERRGITVGTVSGTSVPIGADDSGAGDVLPAQDTDIIAMVPTEEALTVTGDNVSWFGVSSRGRGTIVFANASDAEVAGYVIADDTERAFVWDATKGGTNPLASGAVTKVFFSHADTAAAMTQRAVVLFS